MSFKHNTSNFVSPARFFSQLSVVGLSFTARLHFVHIYRPLCLMVPVSGVIYTNYYLFIFYDMSQLYVVSETVRNKSVCRRAKV